MAPNNDSDHSVEEDNAKLDSQDSIDCYYPCGESHQRSPVIEIDAQGDRLLIVGPVDCRVGLDGVHDHQEQARFRVCSRSLARHSHVMATMFFGLFRESNQRTIELPDDDPDAMKVLLDIAHSNFAPVFELADSHQKGPLALRHLFTDDIYDIVSLADKYLMTQKLQPWASMWIPPLYPPFPQSDEYLAPDDIQRLEKAIFIACQFGHFSLLEDASKRLVWVLRQDQELFTSSIEPFPTIVKSSCSGPAEIGAAGDCSYGQIHPWVNADMNNLDHLRKLRLELIDSILSPLRDFISDLKNTNMGTLYPCDVSLDGEVEVCVNCRMHTFGVLVLFLSREGLYPVPDAADVDMCPRDLHFRLTMHKNGFRDGLWSDCRPLHSCQVRRTLNWYLRASSFEDSSFYSPPGRMVEKMNSRAEQFGFPTF